MTFLAPWALAIGGLAALATVLLHLVAQQRPASVALPTARFIPDRESLVRRRATRPRDLLMLLLRVVALALVALAFAQPVVTPRRVPLARVVLFDVSRTSAEPIASRVVQANLVQNGLTTIIAFDTAARVVPHDSLGTLARSQANGSISGALAAALRELPRLQVSADSVDAVLVSPVTTDELDDATLALRGAWPGAVRLVRTGADTAPHSDTTRLERDVPTSSALWPAMRDVRVGQRATAVRIVAAAFTASDSAAARAGGTVVRWDTTATDRRSEGLVLGDDVVVALMGRRDVAPGTVIARWADATPAATERTLGDGCLRDIGAVLPASGDVALDGGMRRTIRGLLTPCDARPIVTAADSVTVAALLTATGRSRQRTNIANESRRSPWTVWLLVAALVIGLLELSVRRTPVQVSA